MDATELEHAAKRTSLLFAVYETGGEGHAGRLPC